jgi:tetratricopeptide (TPR) repeat protein
MSRSYKYKLNWIAGQICFNNRGNVYKDNGDLDRAIVNYIEALKLKQNDAAVYNNLGEAYEHKGDLDKARAAYEATLSLDSDNTAAQQNLERVRRNPSAQEFNHKPAGNFVAGAHEPSQMDTIMNKKFVLFEEPACAGEIRGLFSLHKVNAYGVGEQKLEGAHGDEWVRQVR